MPASSSASSSSALGPFFFFFFFFGCLALLSFRFYLAFLSASSGL